jgi:ABC-type nitrate/sulfonate/bicarbonate transport system substrate-binding protein
VPVVIGTLPTEDMLPLWVAEEEGLFAEYGLDSVEIVTFQAAQERDAAFVAGEIDAFMGDIIAAAQLEAAGGPGDHRHRHARCHPCRGALRYRGGT